MTANFAASVLIFWLCFLSRSTTLSEYIARVPVYLDGTKPRQLVRYKELPYKDVFKPPCIYPGALIEDTSDDSWMCSLRCECIENGNIWCYKKCNHTQAELQGRKCLISTNTTQGACCPKVQCDDNLKRKKLVSIKLQGTPPGVELFCERGQPMPLSFCSTFSMSGDKYDWGRIPSMARCGPGPMQCLEYYRDYAIDPAVNDSLRYYLYTPSVNATTVEVQREELRQDVDAPHVVALMGGNTFDARERIEPHSNKSESSVPTTILSDVLQSEAVNSSVIELPPPQSLGKTDLKLDDASTTSNTTQRFRET